jgi:hypothetical protein
VCDENVGNDLDGDRLQSWVPLEEAVQEQRQVFFRKIL